MKNQKGFSLIELLVVVIIIGIIAAIAIPSLLSSRRAASEAQAVSNLRTINSAQATYFATVGGSSDYGTQAQLVTAGLLDSAWNTATRGAYTYATALGTDSDGFCTTATTTDTASKSFAVSHPGVIYQVDGIVAPTCDATTGGITGGTVIGTAAGGGTGTGTGTGTG